MKTVVIINGESMGRGSEELGKTLAAAFLRTLTSQESKPETVLFYNSGVKLLCEGSPVLDAVEALVEAGVDLAACGTCLKYYHLADKIVAGRESNMPEIVSTMMAAEKTITI